MPQSAIDAVQRDFPGVSRVRAHQIVRDRELLRERLRMQQRAARQAYRNLYGPLDAGGIGTTAQALLESYEHVGETPELWLSEGGFDAASLGELS